MKRVLAVVLIAALTTLMLGIDSTTWAGQDRDQDKREKQRAAVLKALAGMHRGTTATIERYNGEKFDIVIQSIEPDAITVLREKRGPVVTETIPIADIAKIKSTSVKKMSMTSKVLIGTAVAVGVLVVAGLAACASAYGGADTRMETADTAR